MTVSPTDGTRLVCVLGMHRSGSSLVAQILHANGFAIGPGLLGPSEFNPRGHFEDRFVLGVNKRLLLRFGGTWDRPPTLPQGWLEDPLVSELLARAREYRRAVIEPTRRFVFKEPRTSLLLPFWRRAFGNMSYVVVLRNPDSVVRSVLRRNRLWRSPLRLGWRIRRTLGNWWIGEHERLRSIDEPRARALWDYYYETIVRDTAREPLVTVTYEGLVSCPEKEIPELLRRVIGGNGPAVLGEVRTQLNHGSDLSESREVKELRRRLEYSGDPS